MGGRSLRSVLLILGIAALPGAAWAADAAPAPDSPTEIHLRERVERTLSPEGIHVDLRAATEGNDPSQAIAAVDRLMSTALERAKGASAVKVALGAHVVVPAHRTDAPVRWQAAQLLALRGKDSHTVLTLTAQLQREGLTVTAMRFVLPPETVKSTQAELTKEALKELKARAEAVAADMGMQVEQYRSFRIGNLVERQEAAQTLPQEGDPPPPAKAAGPTVWLTVDADVVLQRKERS